MRYALVGVGRMGRAIECQADRRGHVKVAELDVMHGSRLAAGELGPAELGHAEVAFEFTVPEAGRDNVLGLVRLGIAVVCGTTGWAADDEFRRAVEQAPAGAVVASNFSLGMRLFARIVREAARVAAGAGSHRATILEAHHTGKRDAPSGTARELAKILLECDPRIRSIHPGNPDGPLPDDALHVVSLRAESEPGMHTVAFDGEYDRIELTHRARGREGFAAGAVLAAEWIVGRQGLHDFESVVDTLLDPKS
jgi:4-hydroxy-tetrahydrodipicolinate reductase